jgi:hypothetical protein
MSLPLRRSLILAAALRLFAPLCPAAAPAATPIPTIQQRIDALLKHRLRPEPLPVDLPNPFQVFSGGIRDFAAEGAGLKPLGKEEKGANAGAPGANQPKALPAPTSAEVLGDCAARLKIGGIITAAGQKQIAINGVLRKEGDIIMTEWNNSLVHLRVVRFVSGQVVLRYREAEMTIKF